MAVTTQHYAHRSALPGSVAYWIDAMRDAVVRRRNYRRTYVELSRLSDHQLEDLGLRRSMLKQTAMETVYNQLR